MLSGIWTDAVVASLDSSSTALFPRVSLSVSRATTLHAARDIPFNLSAVYNRNGAPLGIIYCNITPLGNVCASGSARRRHSLPGSGVSGCRPVSLSVLDSKFVTVVMLRRRNHELRRGYHFTD